MEGTSTLNSAILKIGPYELQSMLWIEGPYLFSMDILRILYGDYIMAPTKTPYMGHIPVTAVTYSLRAYSLELKG